MIYTSFDDSAAASDSAVIALVGNPNVGKSAIFNLLTGRYAVVSNYPGTTVEICSGTLRSGPSRLTVIDTPGANSLTPKSEDERVTRDILLEHPLRAVVQVADAKNLRRSLMLTVQLAEMAAPVVLDLNMWDECMDRGIHIKVNELAQELGVPIVRTVATQRRGIRELLEAIGQASVPKVRVDYGAAIEDALLKIEEALPGDVVGRRALGLMMLSEDSTIEEVIAKRAISPPASPVGADSSQQNNIVSAIGSDQAGGRARHRYGHGWDRMRLATANAVSFRERVRSIREKLQQDFSDPLSYVISQKRASFVDGLVTKVMSMAHPSLKAPTWRRAMAVWATLPVVFFLIGFKLADMACWLSGTWLKQDFAGQWIITLAGGVAFAVACMLHLLRGAKSHRSLSEQLGNLTMHPMFAFPILIIVLWLLYKIVGQFGAGTCVDFCQKTIFQGYLLPSVESWAAKVASPESLAYQVFFSHDAGLISVGLTYSLSIVGPIVTFFFLAFGLMEDSGYLPRLAVMLDKTFKKIGLTGKAALPMVLGLGCDTMATLTARILDTRKQRTIAILLLALAVPCSAQLGVISAVLGSVSGLAFSIYVLVIVSQLLFVGFLASKVIPGAPADFMIEIPPFRVPDVRNIVVKTLYRLHWFLREAVPLFLLGTFILFVLMQLGILRWLETGASPLVVGVLGLPKETTAGFILGFLRRDYGVISIFAALDKVEHGHIAPSDLLVALTVMTLFVPCLANFFVMIKEQGMKRAAAIVAFIFPYAFLVGGLLRQALRFVGI